MISWMVANAGTIVITLILALAVAGIIVFLIKEKKQSKSSCGGNCAHCKMCSGCKNAGEQVPNKNLS
ncbi:MAG: FeoB-associated Cys-rich membrane protein [Lachnospiraceae bacterium]|nr:FeoB-associated Cys-rich membrane protein [Lachnospiraceae bacterium]